MKVLILSDGHGAVDKLDALAEDAKAFDIVLFGGDFAAFKKIETGLPFLERLAAFHDRVFAVTGNCDAPDFRETVESYDMSVEGTLSYFSGLMLSGSGGGSKFTGTTPNERTDEELVGDLRLAALAAGGSLWADDPDDSGDEDDSAAIGEAGARFADGAERLAAGAKVAVATEPRAALDPASDGEPWNNLIVIAHNPPKDTKLDMIPNGVHVGSPLIRAFIESKKPLLVVSGHIHESAAIDTIGPTTLVNPGALADGRYAVAEITGGAGKPFAVASIELKTLS
ncbi:MAG TPA: metallophosphoesterase family protein [Treponemataceae bacterium]|nr:metallophosphoesterase family protein [Treponemataceae bacterium]